MLQERAEQLANEGKAKAYALSMAEKQTPSPDTGRRREEGGGGKRFLDGWMDDRDQVGERLKLTTLVSLTQPRNRHSPPQLTTHFPQMTQFRVSGEEADL